MATTFTETNAQTAQVVLRLRGDSAPAEWIQRLADDGFAVVPDILSPERASDYVNEAYKWLESASSGFSRQDKSTWTKSKLPPVTTAGMYSNHGINHEQFLWDLRDEPGLIDTFAQLWGTDELLVSFDCASISLPPVGARAASLPAPWPHVDQSPLRRGKHCVQGIVNLVENGPHDGGLMILRGSMALFNEFFETHRAPTNGWPESDWYPHRDDELQWFYDRGCEWEKVCASPGSVILWDSRCVHYGTPSTGDNSRIAAYVCYKPANMITEEVLSLRKLAYHSGTGSTHDPVLFCTTTKGDVKKRREPVLSERAQKLVGLLPYNI